MARAPKGKTTSAPTALADRFEEFEAMFGSNDAEATVKDYITTGYCELNHALTSRWDDGFPRGRIIEVAGPSASGKTFIAQIAMIEAQLAGGICGFFDHERSFQLDLARNLGLDTSPRRFIYRKPKTFEESLQTCLDMCKAIREKGIVPATAPIVWVFDSLASMVPMSVLYDPKTGQLRSLTTRTMNDTGALARATSAAFPAFAQLTEELGVTVIFLNQVRTKIGVVYGDPRTTPGGDAPKFYATTRLMLGSASKITKGKGADSEVLGVEVSCTVIKNKVNRPFKKASWRFMYREDGSGRFDVIGSTVAFLLRIKALPMSGNYIEWEGSKLYPSALIERLEAEGNGATKLLAFLPAAYEGEEDGATLEQGPPRRDTEADVGSFDPRTADAA